MQKEVWFANKERPQFESRFNTLAAVTSCFCFNEKSQENLKKLVTSAASFS